VPFYIAAPVSTFDFAAANGDAIPIEYREDDEVRCITGLDTHDRPCRLRLAPTSARVANPAFDLTPANCIDGFITERGIVNAEQIAAVLNMLR
jgi:methylthioribose-1-phosphate isomerase